MFIFSSRPGLALVLAALCPGGQTAHAQAAPVPYWIPSWVGFGGDLTAGQSFDGRDTDARYNFSNGWFVGGERGVGLSMNGINQDGAFGNFGSLYYQGVQYGYNFQIARGLPLTVYAGFDTLKYNPASVALLPPSTPCPAHCQAMARMRASSSSRRRMSACHSGSATPNNRAHRRALASSWMLCAQKRT